MQLPSNENMIKFFTLIGIIVSGIIWIIAFSDPFIATEAEVMTFVASANHAGKGDVNHIANIIIDQQIDATERMIKSLEDKEDEGETNARDRRKLERLRKASEQYKSTYIPDGHIHGGVPLRLGDD